MKKILFNLLFPFAIGIMIALTFTTGCNHGENVPHIQSVSTPAATPASIVEPRNFCQTYPNGFVLVSDDTIKVSVKNPRNGKDMTLVGGYTTNQGWENWEVVVGCDGQIKEYGGDNKDMGSLVSIVLNSGLNRLPSKQ